MRRWITLLFLTVCASEVAGTVDYDDFPTTLQSILDERIAALNTEGGICIAGRVTLSDGAPIHSGADAQVNFQPGLDEPTRMYEGGWFIMGRTLPAFYASPGGMLAVRAFGYDPLDAPITVLTDEVTYADLMLMRTPSEQLSSVMGVVTDEDDQPFSDAKVSISFPFANFGIGSQGPSYPRREQTTGLDGRYEFTGLSDTAHSAVAWAPGYAFHSGSFTPPPGETAVENRRLYPNRTIRIRYVHQRDGTRNFTGGDLQVGTIYWLNGDGGVDFSEGRVEGYDWEDLRDLELRQYQDVLMFRVFYVTGRNGYYDAGAIDFDDLMEAAESGYGITTSPVLVGHVYVVHTYEEDQFVKFLVESDEFSFRTVITGDPDPLVFAGYGLTVDFTFASQNSQLFVQQELTTPSIVGADSLPSVWQLSGMEGATFEMDLAFTYHERDLVARRILEPGLDLFWSGNQGGTWQALQAVHDRDANALTVEGLQAVGWFAIGNLTPVRPGDLDQDGDIDLKDGALLLQCFTGDGETLHTANCIPGLFDDDAAVGLGDVVSFVSCMSGPAVSPQPACGG